MRCGFQTLSWGRRIEDLDLALDQIAACGYEGVEIAQAPGDIWIHDPHSKSHRSVESISEILTRLASRKLTLIGLAGGSLEQRIKFCGDFRPDYLYQDRWDAETEAVTKLEVPFTIGLHPHLFMPVNRLNQVRDIFKKNNSPHLKLIPDTAHLTIAEDDPIEALRLFPDRIAAVHLKDWNPNFGRYSHRYAHGFARLGQGIVLLKETVAALKQMSYQGWIVAEQDTPEVSPVDSALHCAKWLAGQGLPIKPDEVKLKAFEGRMTIEKLAVSGLDRGLLERGFVELTVLRSLHLAQGKGSQAFYQSVTDSLSRLMPCASVHLWLFSPAHKRLELVAATGHTEQITNRILDHTDFLVSQVAKAEEIQRLHLSGPARASAFLNEGLLQRLPLDWMISVPIFNSSNPHHLRFLLNLFPSEWPFPEAGDLTRIGEHISRAADSLIDELCLAAAGSASYICGRSTSKEDFLERLVRFIRRTFNCEGVAVFLVNQTRERLELAESTDTEWDSKIPLHQRYYLSDQGLTGKAWAERGMFFAPHAPSEQGWAGRSREKVSSLGRDECLFAAIVKPKGRVLGVIRCTNKVTQSDSSGTTMFTDDDAAVLESIIQAALPHLELLLHHEQQFQALGRLTHEFLVPVVAIRGAVDLMRHALKEKKTSVKEFFGEDYLTDIWDWTNIIGRLTQNADVFRAPMKPLRPVLEHTFLKSQVIAPAVHQVGLLLRESLLAKDAIQFSDFKDIPPLWIDKNQFQQVCFNLLSNAIKYGRHQKAFRVRIDGGRTGNGFEISIYDYGDGIPDGQEEIIFEPGFRGGLADHNNVVGQGLGLAVARAIIEAHGGSIRVTNRRNPTRFTIFLPKSLGSQP